MIVREKPGSFLLVKQHDHALASGTFAEYWAGELHPREPTLHAVTNHDVAWRDLDREARWNEAASRPYSFTDYPVGPKVRAYAAGIDWLEARDPYAACLCSMHYETLARDFGKTEEEARFAEAEARRQAKLGECISGEESRNLARNLRFLKLCDGLSLFVCLNEPGEDGKPPPYPGGFEFDGVRFEPRWEDERTLSFRPEPFSEPFEIEIPYREVGKDRRRLESGFLQLRIT